MLFTLLKITTASKLTEVLRNSSPNTLCNNGFQTVSSFIYTLKKDPKMFLGNLRALFAIHGLLQCEQRTMMHNVKCADNKSILCILI